MYLFYEKIPLKTCQPGTPRTDPHWIIRYNLIGIILWKTTYLKISLDLPTNEAISRKTNNSVPASNR